MLRTYSSSGLKNIQTSGREIIPTTKDKLDAALNAPPTAAVLEKEVHNRIVEDNYLLSGSRIVTQDNDESDDEVVVEGKIQTQ